jgi:hypothetical protein
MEILLSRGSVCAGDDVDAPHSTTISLPDTMPLLEALSVISNSGYLARIAGGKATWSAVSNVVLAVLAQQWSEPRALSGAYSQLEQLNFQDGRLRIHFTYHGQQDPETVLAELSRNTVAGL